MILLFRTPHWLKKAKKEKESHEDKVLGDETEKFFPRKDEINLKRYAFRKLYLDIF